MVKKTKAQCTTSSIYPPQWSSGSRFRYRKSIFDGLYIMCGFLHYHKYTMPAGLGKDGPEFKIMLTDGNDKPLAFLHQDGNGVLTLLAAKCSETFDLLTVNCDLEKEFKRYPKYKEY